MDEFQLDMFKLLVGPKRHVEPPKPLRVSRHAAGRMAPGTAPAELKRPRSRAGKRCKFVK